ncbi:MAG TPA: molybdopterin-dependent oxidoreductase [Myxococcales bacterium]|jgi:anaerobic selenocysteine-containing dehydrogenase
MPSLRTACTYDCPDACALVLVDEGGEPRLKGDPDHPITRGFTCLRVRSHLARLRAPDRVLSPLLREAGGWRPVSWDAALDLAAEKLSAALDDEGPESVLLLQSGGSLGISKELVGHFFRSLGPVVTLRGGVCGEAGEEAQRADFGDCADHDYSDLASSAAIVLWGKNPVETGPHLVPFLEEAKGRGVPRVLIDVRPTPSEKLVDRVIRVAPGGDGALALAVLRRLQQDAPLDLSRVENAERFLTMLARQDAQGWARLAGVAPADVDFLASLYGAKRPVSTWVGWGLQRRKNGGASLRCIDALGLCSGNVGVAGGGVNFTSWRRRGLDQSMLAPATGRTVAAPTLAHDLAALREPPARFTWLCAANPVASFADSTSIAAALKRPGGFVVVCDGFLTDTAECADLFLPVSLMLEEDDAVGSYAHHHVARAHRVVDPPEGVRGDVWICHELSKRLNLPEDPLLADPARALERMVAPWFAAGSARNPGQDPIPFAKRFPTPSGQARLVETPPAPALRDPAWPLQLLTPSCQAWQTSQHPMDAQQGPMECRVHPESASGLGDGAKAKLVTPRGTLTVLVKIDVGLPRDLVVVYRGGSLAKGRAANAVVPQQATDYGEGTAFYDVGARLER